MFCLTGCAAPHEPSGVPLSGSHYVIGAAYQAGGEWQYPRVFAGYDRTGLAAVIPPGHPPLTADGAAFDQNDLAAQSPVLPLPSLVEVTDLVTGRGLTVLVNDRGPMMPGRILAVTRKVADRLGFPDGDVSEVRVRLLSAQSAALQDRLGAGPDLTAAPVAAVQRAALPPPGIRGEAGAGAMAPEAASAEFPVSSLPLSDQVSQTTPDPGPLYVEIGGFGARRDAFAMLYRLTGLAGTVVAEAEADRLLYAVHLGPYHSAAAADAALQAVLARGVGGPEITVR